MVFAIGFDGLNILNVVSLGWPDVTGNRLQEALVSLIEVKILVRQAVLKLDKWRKFFKHFVRVQFVV